MMYIDLEVVTFILMHQGLDEKIDESNVLKAFITILACHSNWFFMYSFIKHYVSMSIPLFFQLLAFSPSLSVKVIETMHDH